MKVQPIGHLHFKVSSRSRKCVEHLVELLPEGETKTAFCGCEAHTMHPTHHGKHCAHIRAVVAFLQRQLKARP